MGYSNVRDYEDGKQDWIEAGLPVEAERATSQNAVAAENPASPVRPAVSDAGPINASTHPQDEKKDVA